MTRRGYEEAGIIKVVKAMVFVFLISCKCAPAFSAAVDCPPMPDAVTSVSRDVKVGVNGEVGKVAKVTAAGVGIQVDVRAKNLQEKFPNVDRLLLIQMMSATYCEMLNQGKTISETEKLRRWEAWSKSENNLLNHDVNSVPAQKQGTPPNSGSSMSVRPSASLVAAPGASIQNSSGSAIYQAGGNININTNPVPSNADSKSSLKPDQLRLLTLLQQYQVKLGVRKLVVDREHGTVFTEERGATSTELNFMTDLHLHDSGLFVQLFEEMPSEYVRFFPEARYDNPFVVGITEQGQAYLDKYSSVDRER